MVSKLRDIKLLLLALPGDPVDHTMLISDVSGPPTLKIPFQSFRFAASFKRFALSRFDQLIDTIQNSFTIAVALPMLIIFPRFI